MSIAVSPPTHIAPAEVELLATAILLRAGLYAQPIPAYRPTENPKAMPYGWRRVWGRVGG
ncbi:hypothetical protein [uncultured Methylobacterium sp.]|uniref:hypothetical protein n=1 Tax=uncultured Methylobacterium sp. TaxID=157278 RepID=UPI0035CC2ADB